MYIYVTDMGEWLERKALPKRKNKTVQRLQNIDIILTSKNIYKFA